MNGTRIEPSEHTTLTFHKRASNFNLERAKEITTNIFEWSSLRNTINRKIWHFLAHCFARRRRQPTQLKIKDLTTDTPLIMKKPHCQTWLSVKPFPPWPVRRWECQMTRVEKWEFLGKIIGFLNLVESDMRERRPPTRMTPESSIYGECCCIRGEFRSEWRGACTRRTTRILASSISDTDNTSRAMRVFERKCLTQFKHSA